MTPYPSLHLSRRFGTRLARRMFATLIVSILAVVAVPMRSLAQVPTFNALQTTYTGNPNYEHPNLAGVGDFNGDGKLDALVSTGSANVRLMLGNGDGTFIQSYVSAPGAGNLSALKVADLNGDGKLDAITASNQGNLAATVLINTGNDANGVPQFTATNYTNPGFGTSGLRSLTVGDLNGDGKPDFIVGDANGSLRVWLNNGDGTFSGGQYYGLQPGAGGPSVGPGVIADFNGDGKADYLVTSNQNNAINVFFGNGDGTFQATPAIIAATNGMWPVVADFNNDGKPDFLAVDIGTGMLQVYLNTGNGTFSGPTLYPTGLAAPGSLALTDMNGDGKLDVVTSDYNNGSGINNVAVLLGNGDGTFGTANLYNSTQRALDLSVGDFNGDGKPDIATVGYNNDTYGVLLNTTVFAPPAQMFFTDALTGPSSPNLATIPAGKYGYTASGLQRTQSSSTTDRPTVTTKLSTYLTANTFIAEVTVNLATNDLLFFGVGQGDADASYNNEPAHGFYFRVHNAFQGYSGIQADVRSTTGSYLAINEIGTYVNGSPITLRLVRAGDQVTMSVVGGGSVSYNLSSYPSLGLTNTNTRVFFGTTNVGSVFSNLKIYQLPPPVVTSESATGPYGSLFSYQISATNSPTSYGASSLPAGLSFTMATGVISGTLPNTVGTSTIGLSATNGGGSGTGVLTLSVVDTTPPIITAPSAIIAEATGVAGAMVNFTATANDAISGSVPVTATPASGSTFPLGLSVVTLSAVDAAGNHASGVFSVTVRDTTPPVLTLPASQTLEANGPTGAVATFAASATDLVTVSPTIAYSVAPGSTFALGTTTVTVTATDAAGNATTGSFTITVRDTTPPVIKSLTANPATLWPPNHKMVNVTITAIVADLVDPAPITKIVSVTSNEAVKNNEDDHHSPDWLITGNLTLQLRAERLGKGTGRIYTIVVQSTDAAGNVSTKTVAVTVPKDRGDKDGHEDDDKKDTDSRKDEGDSKGRDK